METFVITYKDSDGRERLHVVRNCNDKHDAKVIFLTNPPVNYRKFVKIEKW